MAAEIPVALGGFTALLVLDWLDPATKSDLTMELWIVEAEARASCLGRGILNSTDLANLQDATSGIIP